MPNALDRTFGFELEVAEGANELAAALTREGLSLSHRRHDWHCSCENCSMMFGRRGNWFKVQRDSSCGGEVISSILKWGYDQPVGGRSAQVNPLELIDKLTDIMVNEDIPVDDRCGLHVHVGARDLTDPQLGRLYQLMHHYEAILYRLACGRATRHRGYNNGFNYCRPMSGFDNPVESRELAWLKSSQVKSSPIAYNKYVMANMVPIENLGTVELRLWEATRSKRRLRMYTKLSVALVQRARQRRNPGGRMLPLGEEGNDSDFAVFLADLQQAVPELVDTELVEDLTWQWEQGPARWQPAAELPPLPHFTYDGGLAVVEDDLPRVSEQHDSHGRRVQVPAEHDLLREERARQQYRNRPIAEHLRVSDDTDPNYDCGYSWCEHDRCEGNRVVFWLNVDNGIIRDPNEERRERERAERARRNQERRHAEYERLRRLADQERARPRFVPAAPEPGPSRVTLPEEQRDRVLNEASRQFREAGWNCEPTPDEHEPSIRLVFDPTQLPTYHDDDELVEEY